MSGCTGCVHLLSLHRTVALCTGDIDAVGADSSFIGFVVYYHVSAEVAFRHSGSLFLSPLTLPAVLLCVSFRTLTIFSSTPRFRHVSLDLQSIHPAYVGLHRCVIFHTQSHMARSSTRSGGGCPRGRRGKCFFRGYTGPRFSTLLFPRHCRLLTTSKFTTLYVQGSTIVRRGTSVACWMLLDTRCGQNGVLNLQC